MVGGTEDVAASSVKWCAVSLDEVVSRGKRLEASVFDVEARNARAIIADGKYPLTTICGKSGFATAYVCGRFKRIWVERSDKPIYQPSEIVNVCPTPDGWLSKRTRTDFDALRVHKGQVLLTCSGTIGKVSFVSDTLDGKIFSHDLLRIDCKRHEDAGYVYAYLKSRIGNKILLTNSYGAVITHIEPGHLDSVAIPDAPEALKRKINDLVVKSYELRDESNALIDKATAMLVEELKLPPIEKLAPPTNAFSVKLDDWAGRLDASYHVPIVGAIVGHLKRHAAEVTTVADPRVSKNVILPGRFKRVYVEEGYGRIFIGGKQIHELDPSNKKYLSLVHHKDRIGGQLELHENMTLVTCSGTIGRVTLVGRHWENWTANQHIIRIVPANDGMAGFLNIWLSTGYAHHLIVRHTYGSVIDEIDDAQVRSIPVPLLKNKAVQNEINALALQANEKRYEAYNLEQKALSIMDREVLTVLRD